MPVSSFCEYDERSAKRPTWFARSPCRPPFAFAGIWRPWRGARGTKAERKALQERTGSEEDEHLLFSFLTCEPNELVAPVHPKCRATAKLAGQRHVGWPVWLAGGRGNLRPRFPDPRPEGAISAWALAACRSGVSGRLGWRRWRMMWRASAGAARSGATRACGDLGRSNRWWRAGKPSIRPNRAIGLRSCPPARTSASCSTPWSRASTRHGRGPGRAAGTDGIPAPT